VNSEVRIIDGYVGHWSLKRDLVRFLENHHDAQNRETNVKATMTDWTLNWNSQPVDDFKKFILSSTNSKTIVNFWANIYRRGDYTIKHDHIRTKQSVVYFLKSKPNFAPLIVDSKPSIIKPLEGRMVIFPGSLKHCVPVHFSDETRITLAANLN
tara:strand:- start:37 stop:498 length:462 start_codon:yes stop_codon:yes gene_type:complete